MAKKKKQQAAPRQQIFKSTPFSVLKGVTVTPAPAAPVATPVDPAPQPPADNDAALFLEAMEGVMPVAPRAQQKKTAVQPSPGVTVPLATPSSQARLPEVDLKEREAFAQAIGQLKLDVTFTEQVPGEEELKPMGANRLRQLKRGVVSVDRQLDLHGLTREEALEALARFVASAAAHGEKAMLIITGKGNNSPGEPVLQQAVAGWLRDAGRKLVVEFAPAPREMGGSGAFVVFLRRAG